jgi:hypothetical protein
MNGRRPVRTAVFALTLAAACAASAAAPLQDTAALRRQAFDLSYNLDRQEALAILRKAAVDHPGDAAVHRALDSVLWLSMLFHRGAVTVDHYLGSFSRTQVELSKPPADLDAEFRTHVARAIELAEARVAQAPSDVQAHYDLGAAVGLRASHIATVEGRLFAGFKAARRAFDLHERVLALDPRRKDAGLVVGTYRYVVSTLSLPMRMMAYVVGFGGGRTSVRRASRAFACGGSEVKNRSVSPTAPSFIDSKVIGRPSRKIEISVEPPPMSIFSVGTPLAAQPCEAATPIRRASSIPESISTLIPVFSSMALMKLAELFASRTAAVAVATILCAPRASAIDRKRAMHSVARRIAARLRWPFKSVSWPSRTTSLSRESTANESLAAASTTTSLIEFEPMSMAANFKGGPLC